MILNIKPIDATWVRLEGEPAILYELAERFSFKIPNARFNPMVKAGRWNGIIKLIKIRDQKTYKGLVPAIIKYCKISGYEINIDSSIQKFFKRKIEIDWDWLELPESIEPRDYQYRSVEIALAKKRSLLVSSTGSGKSLIIYAIVRHLLAENRKILLITKQTQLVEQMRSDFIDYARETKTFDVDDNVHLIYGGKKKTTDKPMTISTWQSQQKIDKKFLAQFDTLIFDEVHSASAKVATSIIENMPNAEIRIGLTGTLQDAKTHEMSLTGLFGPPKTITETQELIDRGILADMTIRPIILKYSKQNLSPLGSIARLKYQNEINFVVSSQERLAFVAKLCANLKGNVLLLFNYIEKHGEPQFDAIQAAVGESKKVGMVHGSIKVDVRVALQQEAETRNDMVLCASYPIFQEGVNIKNIDHVVLCSPTKSKIRLFQSIGRGLRKRDSDSKLNVWDIVDDLRGDKKTMNFAIKHFLKRHEMYSAANHKVRIVEKKLN